MKKFMFFLMVLGSFAAAVTMIVTLISGSSSLPLAVLIGRGLLIAWAFVLIIKKSVSWMRQGELNSYFIVEAVLATFNLIYLSLFSSADVSLIEYVITGTLITPVFNIVLLLLSRVSRNYVSMNEVDGLSNPPASSSAPQVSAIR